MTPVIATTALDLNFDEIIALIDSRDDSWQVASFKDLSNVPHKAGVYCIVLPEKELPENRTVILHGRTFGRKGERRQLQFEFRYKALKFREGEGVVVYVGKASGLFARIKGHLSTGKKATTNQVLRGLAGKLSQSVDEAELKAGKELLLKHGKVFYNTHHHQDESQDHRTCEHMGLSFVAGRDLLEIKLIAKYAPPFNIKAER